MTVKNLKQILLVVLIMLIPISWGCSGNKDAALLARQGVIDLSKLDMMRFDPVRLDGEWEFYWNQLLSPEDFREAQVPVATAFLTLPDAWNGFKLNDKKLGGKGFATFRLRILPGSGKRELALHLDDVNSAYRLWANGKLLVESGVVGMDAPEETPNQSIQQPRLYIGDQPVELVLQISNHHYREGGVVSSIKLGPADKLEAAQLRAWGLALFCIGSLMVMGIYHIVLFCFRRKNIAPLYFGIYCLLWMAYSFTSNSNGWIVHLFLGNIPVRFLNRIDLFCFVISVPVGYSFLRTLYPKEFSRRLQHAAWGLASVFVVMGLAVSTMSFTTAIPIYYLVSIVMILYSIAMLSRAMHRGREGASFILSGFIVLGLAGINDMLYDLQLLRSVYLTHIGMFVFILFQAVALSLRFSKAFSAIEQLSGELSDKNLALEEEIAERTRLEREIVNVSEDERRRISHDLHDGLCQQLTGARLHFPLLERKLAGAGRQQPEMTQLSSLLEESVNHAYDLSRGLWPVEHDPHGISPSLEELTRRLAESSGIAIEFSQERGCVNCSNAGVTQLFRIAQEAITNAVKHARASRIVIGIVLTMMMLALFSHGQAVAADVAASPDTATVPQPVMVKDINASKLGASSNTNGFVAVGGVTFFSANDRVHGQELWKSDGTEAGTVLVKDINPIGSSFPQYLTDVGGVLYFTASGVNGMEPWKSDGTTAGTMMLKQIFPGTGPSMEPMMGNSVVNVNGVWKSDGTGTGTVQVKDINPGVGMSSNPSNLPNGAQEDSVSCG